MTKRLLCGLLTSIVLCGAAAEPGERRRGELMHLLKHDCGSCHGMTLRGGLGPPLTAERLHRANPTDLSEVILHGRTGTAMPPWQGVMTRAEAQWLSRQLLQGVGE